MKLVLLLLRSALLCNIILQLVCCNAGSGQPAKNGIAFDSLSVDKSYYINDIETNPGCSLQIRFVYPVVVENNEIQKKLQQQFIVSFFNDVDRTLSPAEAAAWYVENYINVFKSEEKEYQAEVENLGVHPDEVWFTYELIKSNEVVYNQDGLLSFVVQTSSYTGGAHGAHSVENYVLDVKTGQYISENEIFVDKYKEELSHLLVDEIVRMNEVKDARDLETIGFFDVNEIVPNNNFYADETGITYTFNEYEIAAYVVGAVSVHLPYDKIRHILRREGPLAHVAFR
ncbi:MAG: DUF3298 and DUF4163 domain-containing protein [Tannerella sp.]|jgi:hypothetical protein|nr:DUF3298 and DUF4163 domain-containing protein [Tannerella sp.]